MGSYICGVVSVWCLYGVCMVSIWCLYGVGRDEMPKPLMFEDHPLCQSASLWREWLDTSGYVWDSQVSQYDKKIRVKRSNAHDDLSIAFWWITIIIMGVCHLPPFSPFPLFQLWQSSPYFDIHTVSTYGVVCLFHTEKTGSRR